MNAPFHLMRKAACSAPPRLARLRDAQECARIAAFLSRHPAATPFHWPAWLGAVARATGARDVALIQQAEGEIIAYLPLNAVRSPIFGGVIASSGFAVGGGLLLTAGGDGEAMLAAACELAERLALPAIALRGGALPAAGDGWEIRRDAHCGFVRPLAHDDEAELLAVPRKQRAELRKGLAQALTVAVGRAAADRAAHYAVYAASVHNLGTPVFPRRLFAEVLQAFGDDAEILTIRHQGVPVASVLSLYHRGPNGVTVMPYWGGGTAAARRLRANDRMYFELMRHARARGCTHFDFGRSKTGSGAYDFKRNWGFEPEPLAYASWTAPGALRRDADPTSAAHAARIAVWRRLPLSLTKTIGPLIARGLG